MSSNHLDKGHPQNTPFKDAYCVKTRVPTIPKGASRTKQSFKDECDINTIMAQYQSTGILPNLNAVDPQYLDVTEMDFQEHQNFIAGANSLFYELPSGIRAKFENNPALFLDFCSHEKNRPELAEMGLLRPIDPEPIPAPELTPSNLSKGLKSAPPEPAASGSGQ